MISDAKIAAPSPLASVLRQPVWDRLGDTGIHLFSAPPGYLVTDCLATTLAARATPVMWLRLGSEDTDPAILLRSIIHAGQRVSGQIGLLTLEQMRRRLGPVLTWPPLFSLLGQELADRLPTYTSIVIENLHLLHASQALTYLLADLLPHIAPETRIILVSEQPLKRDMNAVDVKVIRVDETPLTEGITMEWAAELGVGLSRSLGRRLTQLTQGRAEAILSLLRACQALGVTPIQPLIERSRGMDILAQLAQLWFSTASLDTHTSHTVLGCLGYLHPQLSAALGVPSIPPSYPWLQPLEGEWARLRRLWQVPLQSTLHVPPAQLRDTLGRVAAYCVEQDAAEYAVSLYHELGDNENTATTLEKLIDPMMADGRWETLKLWLQRLPSGVRERRPWLVYTLGEIAAGQGDLDQARRLFATSASCFDKLNEGTGACQSWLAESALAIWQNDTARGLESALRALTIARQRELPWQQCWANWQVACLKGEKDQLDEALHLLIEAQALATPLNDRFLSDLLRLTERVIRQRYDLHRQREQHRRAYFDVQAAEQDITDQLRLLLRLPTEHHTGLLELTRWSQTPLAAKLPAPIPTTHSVDTPPGLLSVWFGRLFRRRQPQAVEALPTPPPLPVWEDKDRPTVVKQSLLPAAYQAPIQTLSAPSVDSPTTAAPDPVSPPAPRLVAPPTGTPGLTVHLLGDFRVSLNHQPIENWPNNIPQRLFKYLVAHHPRPVKRDLLAREFWPREDEERAKRNLDTNLSILRRMFKAHGISRIDHLQDDEYSLTSSVVVWVDVSEFERRVQAGNRLFRQGATEAAAREYEAAIQLYQGDFLAETPYESWPVRFRDRLKVYYCETVERLCQFYFGQGQYAQCARLCHLYLERDNCRQDIHHLLMRCYQRMGQRTLALQQYQKCADALRKLNSTPDKALADLYQRLCQGEVA